MPDRVIISDMAYDRCLFIHEKFPELGSMGVVQRMAALISLSQNGYLEMEKPPDDFRPNNNRPIRLGGYAFEIPTSRGQHPILFPTIVQILANRPVPLREIYRQVGYHVHFGSEVLADLAERSNNINELYFLLLKMIPDGISEVSSKWITDSSEGISLNIGNGSADELEIQWHINDTSITDNPHACIVGLSGQGKTQFALDLLYQIREQSPDVSFTIMDYKGDLSQLNSPVRKMLESHLECETVTVGSEPMPTVPFYNINSASSEQYAVGITDLIGKLYPRLGSRQRLALRECVSEIISRSEFSDGFGFPILEDELRRYYEEQERQEDGLIEIISRLSILKAFQEKPLGNTPTSLITGNLLVRLNELTADTLPIAFLIINQLYEEMKQLPDVERWGSVTNLRHVIFIDEAHHYLSVSSSPLARIIREGRSKGVAVFLATQSVSDLAGPDGADYREFLSNAFFFKTNLNRSSDIRALASVSDQRVRQVAGLIADLGSAQMLFNRNLGQNLRASVLQAAQFYKRTQ